MVIKQVLNELMAAGLIIRNVNIAVEKLKNSTLSTEMQIEVLFMQGRSIGVYIYKDPKFVECELMKAIDNLQFKPSTAQIILANIRENPHPELHYQESF